MSNFQIGAYTFAQPEWLFLLLALPILAILRGRKGNAASVLFSATAPFRSLGKIRRSKAGFWSGGLLVLALGSLIVGMARPQKVDSLTNVEASGIDIVIALDVSRSMLAEDFTISGNRVDRLVAAKNVTEEFIEARPNDRIGMVAFAGRPYLVSPLTLDHDWLIKNLDRVKIGLVEDGTAIGSAIASAANRLKDRDSKTKLILLLTDGENNSGKIDPLTAAEAAKALGIKIYTIGMGSKGDAPYPVGTNVFGQREYQMVPAEFDETTLKEIAKITDAVYQRATDTQSLKGIFEQIDKLERTTIKVTKYRQVEDFYQWLVGAGLGLLSLQMLLTNTIWRRSP